MLIIQKKGTNQREKQHFKLKFIFLAVYAILFSFFVHILFFLVILYFNKSLISVFKKQLFFAFFAFYKYKNFFS